MNERLARHYGIPNVYGSRFRRVTVTDEARSGLLGQGSILTLTSHAERTSPVRARQVDPREHPRHAAAAAAARCPGAEGNQDGQKPKTMRELLAQHRANPACASCHKLMDPIGFAMENFDAVGAWRTRERGRADRRRPASWRTARRWTAWSTLRQALLSRPEVFVGTLTEKLLTYALGRGLDASRHAGGARDRARRGAARLPVLVDRARHRQ